jgi:hypothetical protein
MHQRIGFGMLVLSLPLILLGMLDVLPSFTVLVGITLGGAGTLVVIMWRSDRGPLLNLGSAAPSKPPQHLKRVRAEPPPLPTVTVDATAMAEPPPMDEPKERPETMLPPPIGDEERRAGIKLVHTDGRRLVLRNRPRRTG